MLHASSLCASEALVRPKVARKSRQASSRAMGSLLKGGCELDEQHGAVIAEQATLAEGDDLVAPRVAARVGHDHALRYVFRAAPVIQVGEPLRAAAVEVHDPELGALARHVAAAHPQDPCAARKI